MNPSIKGSLQLQTCRSTSKKGHVLASQCASSSFLYQICHYKCCKRAIANASRHVFAFAQKY